MTLIDVLGFAAGILTTAAFLPQVLKTWRSKSAKDLSRGMYAILCLGFSMWCLYGVMIGSAPIVLTNGLVLILGSAVLWMKLRWG
ncbi:MAG: hypothetical protein GY915_05605 [bacterium]|nr:hypothetical protein [bacterium]